MMTQKNRILSLLQKGNELTAARAEKMGIGNIHEIVRQLRADGNAVYLNNRGGKNSYRLGTPSRAMVRAAYELNGAAAFN